MGDWVVESPSFIEQLMSNKVVMLNQNGVNEVVKIIEEKDKEIERLKEENNFLKQLIPNEKKYSYGIRVGSDGSETRNEKNNK